MTSPDMPPLDGLIYEASLFNDREFPRAELVEDPHKQRVGLNGEFMLSQCSPRDRQVGTELIRFIMCCTSMAPVTDIKYKYENGNTRTGRPSVARHLQLLRVMHERLPRPGSITDSSGKTLAAYATEFIARVVHLGLGGYCETGVIPELRPIDLTRLESAVQAMEAVSASESQGARDAPTRPATRGGSFQFNEASRQAILRGMVREPPGGCTANLPRHFPNSAPRIHGDGEAVGDHTSPEAAAEHSRSFAAACDAANAASSTANQPPSGGGSAETQEDGPADRGVQDAEVQSARMAAAYTPPPASQHRDPPAPAVPQSGVRAADVPGTVRPRGGGGSVAEGVGPTQAAYAAPPPPQNTNTAAPAGSRDAPASAVPTTARGGVGQPTAGVASSRERMEAEMARAKETIRTWEEFAVDGQPRSLQVERAYARFTTLQDVLASHPGSAIDGLPPPPPEDSCAPPPSQQNSIPLPTPPAPGTTASGGATPQPSQQFSSATPAPAPTSTGETSAWAGSRYAPPLNAAVPPLPEIEEVLDILAERVLTGNPTVGYMRKTLEYYHELEKLVPRPGELSQVLLTAKISKGAKATFQRNKGYLELYCGQVPDGEDFFQTVKPHIAAAIAARAAKSRGATQGSS
eukprot:g9479.t1